MRILYADNSPVSFLGISKVLSQEGVSITHHVSNYKDMVSEIARGDYELLISELRFSDAELLDMASDLRAAFPDLTVLIYTFHVNPTYVARAAAYQFYDFILKNSEIHRLIQSVHQASTGKTPVDSLLNKAMSFLCRTEHPENDATQLLTKRELQILTHLSLGLCNKEISLLLQISLETVKEHVQNVFRKLKANDRTEAAVWALRNGVPTFDIAG